MDSRLALLEEITQASGVSGFEDEVRDVMKSHLKDIAGVSQDNLGSIIFSLETEENAPRIMLAGHMDEIGFMVRTITEEGFIKFLPLGGWWDQVMLGQRVVIRTRSGDVVGLIGSKPPHILKPDERKKVVEKENMFIDVGALDKDQAIEEFGIRPGDPIIPVSPFQVMKNEKLLISKAWDNRVGCALVVEALKSLKKTGHPNNVYGVGTVQEEVGLRGAATSPEIVKPDIGFALEVGIAGDTPGVSDEEAAEKLGKGPAIMVYDASMVPHVRLRDFVIDTAEAEDIPLQLDAMSRGGTDAGRIHLYRAGVPSLVICVPTRYIHSHAGIIHRDDFDNAVKLITAVVSKLDRDKVNGILGR